MATPLARLLAVGVLVSWIHGPQRAFCGPAGINVVTGCDRESAPALIALLGSIAASSSARAERPLWVHVLASTANGDHAFWAPRLGCIFPAQSLPAHISFRLHGFDPRALTPTIWPAAEDGTGARSPTNPYKWARFLFNVSTFDPQATRFIWLDCDTVVRSDLGELHDLDMRIPLEATIWLRRGLARLHARLLPSAADSSEAAVAAALLPPARLAGRLHGQHPFVRQLLLPVPGEWEADGHAASTTSSALPLWAVDTGVLVIRQQSAPWLPEAWSKLRAMDAHERMYELPGETELQLLLTNAIVPLQPAWNMGMLGQPSVLANPIQYSRYVQGHRIPGGVELEEALRNATLARILHWDGPHRPWRTWPSRHSTQSWRKQPRALGHMQWWAAMLPVAHRLHACGLSLSRGTEEGDAVWSVHATSQPPRFVVYTRASGEAPYAEFFVSWYLRLGFDRILILLQDGDADAYQAVAHNPAVELLPAGNQTEPDALPHAFRQYVTGLHAEWVLLCDMDEFLALETPSVAAYVQAAEARHACSLSAIGFRWAVVEHLEASCGELTLLAAVRDHSAFLGPSLAVKYMTRMVELDDFAHVHYPVLRNRPAGAPAHCVECGGNRLGEIRSDLRHDLRHPWECPAGEALSAPYAHAAMLHVETRSLSNMVTKALTTRFQTRSVQSSERLLDVLAADSSGHGAGQPDVLPFIEALGKKALIPLQQASRSHEIAVGQAQLDRVQAAVERLLLSSASSTLAGQTASSPHGMADAPVCSAQAEKLALTAALRSAAQRAPGGSKPYKHLLKYPAMTLRVLAPAHKRALALARRVLTRQAIMGCLTPPLRSLTSAASLSTEEVRCVMAKVLIETGNASLASLDGAAPAGGAVH